TSPQDTQIINASAAKARAPTRRTLIGTPNQPSGSNDRIEYCNDCWAYTLGNRTVPASSERCWVGRHGCLTGLNQRTRSTYFRRRDFAAATGSSSLAKAAGFFFPSIWARLCFSAAIRSTTGANFLGFSTAVTSPPSSFVSISFFKFSWKLSLYFSGSHSSANASIS